MQGLHRASAIFPRSVQASLGASTISSRVGQALLVFAAISSGPCKPCPEPARFPETRRRRPGPLGPAPIRISGRPPGRRTAWNRISSRSPGHGRPRNRKPVAPPRSPGARRRIPGRPPHIDLLVGLVELQAHGLPFRRAPRARRLRRPPSTRPSSAALPPARPPGSRSRPRACRKDRGTRG